MKKRYIFLTALISYIFVLLSYYLLSVNLGNTPLYLQMRRFIPASLCFVLPFFIVRSISIRTFIISIFTSFLCAITSPFLVYLTYGHSATYLSLPYDFAFGMYIFPFLVLLPILLNKVLSLPKFLTSIINTIAHLLILIPCYFQIAYYIKFKHCLTEKGTMAIYQTNYSEALEYIASLGLLGIIGSIAVIFTALLTYLNSSRIVSDCHNITVNKWQKVIVCLLVIAFSGYSFKGLWHKAYFGELTLATIDYFQSIKLYRTGRNDILENLKVKSNTSHSPETIIIVIGESASRNYMSAFTQMEDDTTPWLTSKKNDSNFILFNNTYACEYSTGPTLSHALTESNYYANLEFNRSLSFIDMAKKAGYNTYWFSNQGVIGAADTPITLVAETANNTKWICQENTQTQYDEELLPYLNRIDPTKNNLIVLHIMGSHIDYNNRYPSNFQKWTDPGETGRLADYKNSLLYTDYFLNKVFTYAQEKLNLSLFLYFSDHGNDPLRSRDPDSTKFVFLRIPFFLYYSPMYASEHPQIIDALSKNRNKFFSNDLMYDTICGLMDVQSNHYDERYSLTSEKYSITKESMLTGTGKRHLNEDPYL